MNIDLKDPRVVRWLVAALLLLVLLPVYFLTSFLPVTWPSRQAEIARLEARHQELSRDLEKARLLVRNLERVERETEILRQQWEVARTLLPEQNEMPTLLRKVTAAGEQSSIEFTLFRPQPVIPRGFYADNPVEVKVRGGYHQTGVFLSRLANLDRIVNVSGLEMKQYEVADEPHTVETSLTLTAYTLGGGPVGDAQAQPQLAGSQGPAGRRAASSAGGRAVRAAANAAENTAGAATH